MSSSLHTLKQHCWVNSIVVRRWRRANTKTIWVSNLSLPLSTHTWQPIVFSSWISPGANILRRCQSLCLSRRVRSIFSSMRNRPRFGSRPESARLRLWYVLVGQNSFRWCLVLGTRWYWKQGNVGIAFILVGHTVRPQRIIKTGLSRTSHSCWPAPKKVKTKFARKTNWSKCQAGKGVISGLIVVVFNQLPYTQFKICFLPKKDTRHLKGTFVA
jgi:hypothetical protein